jgi:hypothetical protein
MGNRHTIDTPMLDRYRDRVEAMQADGRSQEAIAREIRKPVTWVNKYFPSPEEEQLENAHYVPTPEAIDYACSLIREEWSDAEKARRSGSMQAVAWKLPGSDKYGVNDAPARRGSRG